MTEHPVNDHPDDRDERRVGAALTALAEAPGRPDEVAAWTSISARIGGERPSRRPVALLSGAAAAVAAVVAVVVLTQQDERASLEVGPVDTPPTMVSPTTTVTQTTSTVPAPTGVLPGRPLAIVTAGDDLPRLDLYDADTGELVTRGLASSAHSISDISFGPDGTIYFTEELGDSSTVRSVPWDGSAEPTTPFGAGSETSSPALSPDGATFAYVHQGITTDGSEIVLVDTATGDRRALRWAADEPDFFRTNGTLSGLEWSPDGSRLLFVLSYEGSEPMVVPADATSLTEATPVPDLSAFHVHWSGPDQVIGVHHCCYPEFDEQPELRAVDLTTGERTPLEGAGEPVAFDVGADGVIALVRSDGTLALFDEPDGSLSEISTGAPVVEVGF
jgi:sugar lactone lactonase YvrE